ncbi:hypothetical protein PISL3812_04513 [Talaromyces islandicus]|uniref:GST N-terminal domain-containing protein n=1 Tax=Talaromyces islandicus TaxID=28573 RepID=A0A0U1LW95_TALIS|nr:hypothetical protein PISL3812_04513 [Talaromyces islandicus]
MSAIQCTLYHHPYSVCSIMVRYTLALCSPAKDNIPALEAEEKVVDIFNQEQLSQDFLKINPYGQVPVLMSSLQSPICDSLEITHFIANYSKNLIPENYKTQITDLLTELHGLNYFSLSFPGRQRMAVTLSTPIEKRLQDPNITEEYRKALEFKLGVVKRNKVDGLRPEVTSEMERRTRDLMKKIEPLLSAAQDLAKNDWLFNLQQPTALDAHLVVFIQRMRDVGREALIPETLRRYAEKATKTPEWAQVMGDRKSTMVPKN